jgi:hypothetical protein
MWAAGVVAHPAGTMLMTGSAEIDAGRAFAQAARARRRASLGRLLHRCAGAGERLAVYDERSARGRAVQVGRGVREIPIDAIGATLEPSRAALFDGRFRPAPAARARWERIWLAEQRGVALPPISVVAVGDGWAVRDGHHRVSVARARGALTIDAVAETL